VGKIDQTKKKTVSDNSHLHFVRFHEILLFQIITLLFIISKLLQNLKPSVVANFSCSIIYNKAL